MKKILVPIDFSEASENALFFACNLFGLSAIEVTLLHIYGTQSTALLMKSIDGLLIKEAKEKLNALVEKVRAKELKVQLKVQLSKNYPVQSIIALGEKGNFDFIIMGTKGASGIKEVFLGSVAGGVISKSKVPVIVIPANYALNRTKKIVFAVDAIELLKSANLEPLRLLVKLNDSEINILHVEKQKTLEITKSVQDINDFDAKVSYIPGTGNINKDINNYITENNADLLCLIRSKKDFIDRLFSDSVTLKQTFNSPVPLLILRE